MSKLKLKCGYVEHLAVGLMTVLIDMPYDIIGVKYLHWIWHDTDPNVGNSFIYVTVLLFLKLLLETSTPAIVTYSLCNQSNVQVHFF